MEPRFKILHDLNELYVDLRDIAKESDKQEYQNKCDAKFKDKIYDEIKMKDALVKLLRYMQIEYIPDRKKIPSFNEVIDELRKGNLIITQYGRAFIDIYGQGNYLTNKITEVDNKIKEFEGLKDKIITQVLTLMSIIIAIVAYILQGKDLYMSKDFIELCFQQKLEVVSALYIPLTATIVLLVVGLYVITKCLSKLLKIFYKK